MVRMTRFAGRRSLRVAELHFALFGGCLPAMVEFGRHYPSVGHAPKFREIVFSVSQNEHDFGVFLPYWITLDYDWFTVGRCPWGARRVGGRSRKQPCKKKKGQESRCCNYGWLPEPLEPFAIFNQLSESPSSNTVETVKCRHFLASAARAASACCTRFSASTPRISRTGTSSLFASWRIMSAIFRGSLSKRPSSPRNIFRNEPTVSSYSGSKSGAF